MFTFSCETRFEVDHEDKSPQQNVTMSSIATLVQLAISKQVGEQILAMHGIDKSWLSGEYYYCLSWVRVLIRHYLITGRKCALNQTLNTRILVQSSSILELVEIAMYMFDSQFLSWMTYSNANIARASIWPHPFNVSGIIWWLHCFANMKYCSFTLLSACAYICTGRKPAFNSEVHLIARCA